MTSLSSPRVESVQHHKASAGTDALTSAQALIARYRVRAALAFDVIGFAAACPTCGSEAEWVQQRQDTRVRTQITCSVPTCLP